MLAAKKKSNSIAGEQSLGVEMLEILYSYYLLKSLSQEPESNDPLSNMRRMKITQLLTNDIILRLCKFRDNDSRSLSFDQVNKALRKREAKRNRVAGLEDMIKEYRSLTLNLENHRNAYIAHLSKRDSDHLKPMVELANAIGLALKITDRLCGVKNSFKVLDLDLRQDQFGETDG
jgi:hypothetical protein